MSILHFVVFSLIALFVVNLLCPRKQGQPLPGPSPLPIIGNLHQAPSSYPERVYHEWSKKYGPIFKLQYAQQKIIMLSNFEVAKDLLDKRSAIYSNRPHLPMFTDLVGKGHHIIFMPYNDGYRTRKRLQESFLNHKASQSYTVVQDVESKQVLYDLLSSNDFHHQFYRYTSSILFALGYGKRLPRGDEPESSAVAQVMRNLVAAGKVGTWMCDAIPQLNYIPTFLAPWKKWAEEIFQFESRVLRENYDYGMSTSTWNWCKQTSEKPEAKALPLIDLTYNIGNVYEVRA